MIKVDCENYSEYFCALANSAFRALKLSGEALAEAEIVNREQIHSLNFAARGVDKPTDVLSFPSLSTIDSFTKKNYPLDYDGEQKAVRIGSIVICEQVAREQGEEYGHGFEREICYLFVHGLLHLLGFDHENEEDKKKMRFYEEKIIGELK